MALMPSRVKYRKHQKGKRRGIAVRGSELTLGEFGIKALENGWLTNKQIEAARVAIQRKLKRGGKTYINVFPDKSYSRKPAETRMGKGKGAPEGWVAVVRRGKILFEITGVPEDLAKEAIRNAAYKLPFRVKFVSRES